MTKINGVKAIQIKDTCGIAWKAAASTLDIVFVNHKEYWLVFTREALLRWKVEVKHFVAEQKLM